MWWNRAPSCVVMCDHERRGQKSDASSGLPLLLHALSAVIKALKKPDVKVTRPIHVETILRTLKDSQVPDI